MSYLASRLWLYHKAGCLSETYMVKHRHGYYKKGEGPEVAGRRQLVEGLAGHSKHETQLNFVKVVNHLYVVNG